jgi:hypothetical protein
LRCHLEKSHHEKGLRAGRVAQGVNLEIKFQYQKKKKKERERERKRTPKG